MTIVSDPGDASAALEITCQVLKEAQANWMRFYSAFASKSAVSITKTKPVQPVESIHANGISTEGNVIKYASRWRNKNGIADLGKAKRSLSN